MRFLILILLLFLGCDDNPSEPTSSIEVYDLSNQKDYNSDDCTGDYIMEWDCDSNGFYDSSAECQAACNGNCTIEEEGFLVIDDDNISVFHLDLDSSCETTEDCTGNNGENVDYSQCYQNQCYDWNNIGKTIANSYSGCSDLSCIVIYDSYMHVYNQDNQNNGSCISFTISSTNYNIICDDTQEDGYMCSIQ